MIYRTSLKTLFQSINTNLNRLTWEMARLNNSIATGKRVNKPSDDPSGGALILSMRSVLADVKQYNKNVALADDWLKQTESVLQNMKNVVQQANVLTEQMATDTYREENLDVAAQEVAGLIESLIKMGNTRSGDRYIFSGQKTEIQPFTNELTIHDPLADLNNSTDFTGQVLSLPAQLRQYNPLPDVPPQTKVFMIEVTTAGGVGGDSLSRVTIDPPGNHNGVLFKAAASGTAGDGVQIRYVNPGAGYGPPTDVTVAGNQITVNLETDGAGNIVATAQDVIDAVNGNPAASALVSAELAPGNSGNGLVTVTSGLPGADGAGYFSTSGGLDGAAAFRVSEDGGLTWGPDDAFTAGATAVSIWNVKLGHSTLTTNLIGINNDLQFTATAPGESGDGIQVEFVNPGPGYGPPTDVTVVDDRITVNLETDAAGNIVATAADVMNAINAHPVAKNMVTASLVDPKNGGLGVVTEMGLTNLANGNEDVAALGHASLTTGFSSASQNIKFTAAAHGVAGNAVQIEYLDPGAPGSPLSVVVVGNQITINLETDADGEIVSTAQDVINAIRSHTGPPDASDLVTAALVDYEAGGESVVEPMASTYLSGGDDSLTGDQNVQLFFTDDGSPLQLGDRFSMEVSYYQGDDQDLFVNAAQGSRVKMNVTGQEALGSAGSSNNILDTLARLKFALEQHDTKKVAEELPRLDEALDQLTSQMSYIGVRLVRNQFTYNILESVELSSTERMSQIEDLDLTEAVTELQTKQMAYQAVLASTSLITKLSLVDYLT